jgi:hypothetical protein
VEFLAATYPELVTLSMRIEAIRAVLTYEQFGEYS